jgi:hypothetical protein
MLGFLAREIIWYFADADVSAAVTVPSDTMPESPAKPFGDRLSDKSGLPHMNPIWMVCAGCGQEMMYWPPNDGSLHRGR